MATKRQTEAKKNEKAEEIETGFYAVDKALKLNQLRASMNVNNILDPEFDALAKAAMQRAAKIMTDAFEGTIANKRFWPPKKSKEKKRGS
jgi:hypothetical protein